MGKERPVEAGRRSGLPAGTPRKGRYRRPCGVCTGHPARDSGMSLIVRHGRRTLRRGSRGSAVKAGKCRKAAPPGLRGLAAPRSFRSGGPVLSRPGPGRTPPMWGGHSCLPALSGLLLAAAMPRQVKGVRDCSFLLPGKLLEYLFASRGGACPRGEWCAFFATLGRHAVRSGRWESLHGENRLCRMRGNCA